MNNDADPVQPTQPNQSGSVPPTPVNNGHIPGSYAPQQPTSYPPQQVIQQPPLQNPQQTQVSTDTTPNLPASNGRPQNASRESHHTSDQSDTPKREGLRSILSTIGILLIAPLIAIFLTAFVFQSYQVDGPSMETTLQNNDRLIVWKLPRTWARITGQQYVPNRGDVVIFNEPDLTDFGQGSNKQLIKRVIALPGERVVVKDGTVTVYNKDHPDGFRPDKTLPYGENGTHIPTTDGDIDITVPEGQIFVCGDNRPDSLDSRSFGPVPLDNVVGKLAIRILPISNVKRF